MCCPSALHAAAKSWLDGFDAVNEIDALGDVSEMREATQFAPVFLGVLSELKHHMQHAVPAEASLGAFRPVTIRGGRFQSGLTF